MFEDIKSMTTKKLETELKAVRWHIDNCSYGRYELNYEMALVRELNRRDKGLKF